MSQAETARHFRALHHDATPLLLANAWDAGTARLVEGLGAKAVATTSAGVAWSNGYPDGDALPMPLVLAAVRAIAGAVRLPVTVDIEGGYSDDPDMIESNIVQVIEAGGVGINIEDAASPPALLAAKIARARRAAERTGVPLYVNARVDVYLFGLVPEERRVAETLARAAQYREAGADGIFVPALTEPDAIGEIARTIGLPLSSRSQVSVTPWSRSSCMVIVPRTTASCGRPCCSRSWLRAHCLSAAPPWRTTGRSTCGRIA